MKYEKDMSLEELAEYANQRLGNGNNIQITRAFGMIELLVSIDRKENNIDFDHDVNAAKTFLRGVILGITLLTH